MGQVQIGGAWADHPCPEEISEPPRNPGTISLSFSFSFLIEGNGISYVYG
jgi:hypothetical protein